MNLRIRFALAAVAVVVIVAAAHRQNVGMSPAIAAQETISRRWHSTTFHTPTLVLMGSGADSQRGPAIMRYGASED